MPSSADILQFYSEAYEKEKRVTLSLKEYLESTRSDPYLYASAAERIVKAIGEPIHVDTSKDPRLGRIFMNRTVEGFRTFP